jgi:hypothetical protein
MYNLNSTPTTLGYKVEETYLLFFFTTDATQRAIPFDCADANISMFKPNYTNKIIFYTIIDLSKNNR